MTNRANFIYQFTGQIHKKLLRHSSPSSKYAGQPYYVLTIQLPDHTKKSVQVFRSKLAQDQIWDTIANKKCFGSPYTLFCKNQKGYFYLVNWEKIEKPQNCHDLN